MKKWMHRLSGICMILMLLLGMTAPGTELSALGGPAGQTALVVSSGSGRNRTMLTGKKKKKKNKNSSSNNNNINSNNNNNNKNTSSETEAAKAQDGSGVTVEESGEYTSKEEVAAYLHEFGHLPDNFITKNEAKKLGWVNSEGNLDEVAPGKSIGGDYFGNYEGQLPEKKGRDYYECDIDYTGGYRSAKRIIYSDDGLIYYTEDHYQTFEQLYPQQNGG